MGNKTLYPSRKNTSRLRAAFVRAFALLADQDGDGMPEACLTLLTENSCPASNR
jgi:hypothetical protein